ncbi:MAG: hypothetical protein NTU44_14390 [Bacteroidetes bacterium]|nr:hypothetical protein [Bacteroidota bacterium]
MIDKPVLNEKWIKASIIGTIWAASEIVLGSFLHNLKIPFSGNILTAIGLIILISVSYIWRERGLYWRAGLICAVMKTISPSAVIFGPMIAIFTEAALLELSVRLFGKTIFGYIIGAILAMSWNLFQRILNFIIFYGFNIVQLYSNLIKFAKKSLNIHTNLLWTPILLLLLVYCTMGFFSAIIGIKIGRKLLIQPFENKLVVQDKMLIGEQSSAKPAFRHSIIWLFTDVMIIIVSMVMLNVSSGLVWSLFIAVSVTIWSFRYKRALRQLSKPRFWLFFVSITMLTAFLFSRFQPGVNSIGQGLIIGIQMNFRAVIIIVGFSVLGTELYNPKIREFFLKTSFKQLPLALELSFESLPSMIAYIPDIKKVAKNPVGVIYQVVSQAEYRLAEIRKKFAQKVFVISGAVGQGKTTMVRNVIDNLRKQKITVGGFFSPGIIEGDTTIGYDIVDIERQQRVIFLRQNVDPGLNKIGKFCIYPDGLEVGINAIIPARNIKNEIVVIDEVGKLELENEGWADGIEKLLKDPNYHLILTVRDTFAEQVKNKWNSVEFMFFDITSLNALEISNQILKQIQ